MSISKSEAIRRYLRRHPESTPGFVAKYVKCDSSLVYQIRNQLAKQSGASEATTEPAAKECRDGSAVQLSLQLRPDAEIKLRDAHGRLLGTMVVSDAGVIYKRPNQKGNGERQISWSTLDKLMQIGLG